MRLILLDRPSQTRSHFHPIALSRPIFQLRCGMSTLAEKLIAKTDATDVACFVPDYMANVYREQISWPVNDPATLAGDDLLLVHGRVKSANLDVAPAGHSEAVYDEQGELLYARVEAGDLARMNCDSVDGLLAISGVASWTVGLVSSSSTAATRRRSASPNRSANGPSSVKESAKRRPLLLAIR